MMCRSEAYRYGQVLSYGPYATVVTSVEKGSAVEGGSKDEVTTFKVRGEMGVDCPDEGGFRLEVWSAKGPDQGS